MILSIYEFKYTFIHSIKSPDWDWLIHQNFTRESKFQNWAIIIWHLGPSSPSWFNKYTCIQNSKEIKQSCGTMGVAKILYIRGIFFEHLVYMCISRRSKYWDSNINTPLILTEIIKKIIRKPEPKTKNG